MQLLYLTLLFAAQCFVVTAEWGGCHDHSVQENFNMTKYLGTWYEIQRSGKSEQTTRCIMEKYRVEKDNQVKLLTQYVTEDGSVKIHEGKLFYSGKVKNPAKLYFYISNDYEEMGRFDLDISATIPMHYWVLSTDYTTYSLVYSCVSTIGMFHHDYIWIMGRERELSKNVTDYLFDILTKNKITVDVVPTNQNNCKMNI